MDILIVEDEFLAVQKLTKLLNLSAFPTSILGITDGIESTVTWLQSHPQPDLILMDIELADGQSFEIFKLIPITCPVIFTTSYDESAIKSFRGNSLDYLLKPIKKDELDQALNNFLQTKRAKSITSTDIGVLVGDLKKQNQLGITRSQFLVKHNHQLISIDTADIAYFYTSDSTTYLLSKDENRYLIEYTLDDLQNILDPTCFFRVNEQFIVQIESISHRQHLNGRVKIELNPVIAQTVFVSNERASALNEWLSR